MSGKNHSKRNRQGENRKLSGRITKRYAGSRSIKTGLPPGTLVHVGSRKTENVTITVLEYDEKEIQHIKVVDPGDLAHYRDSSKTSWVNIDGLHDTKLLGAIGSVFGLHPLVLEDMLNTEERPKIEDYGDYTFIAVKQLFIDENTGELDTDHQNIILGKGFVISAGESRTRIFDPIRERLESGVRIRKLGADYLAYTLLDAIVDNYFDVLERQGEMIEKVEETLVLSPVQRTLNKILETKNDMLYIHKNIWPLREVANLLERGESTLVGHETRIYLRDLYDHVMQALDTTEIYRDILSGLLDVYLSSVSNRTNDTMKILTIISTIFIPLTFIAGIYGMNFKHIPELNLQYGYLYFWIVSIIIVVAMVIFFHKKKWF
jgi:magnesium transporter